MNEAVRKIKPRVWHNHVPAWVRQSGALSPNVGTGLSEPTAHEIMQGIANCADVDQHGNLVGIIGGKNLALALGRGERTVNRYITHFIEAGVIVLMSRGGPIGTKADRERGGRKPFNAANMYGIPAARGSLDHARVNRRVQSMKPTGQLARDGRPAFAPDVTASGAQATLYPQVRQPSPDAAGYSKPGRVGATPTGVQAPVRGRPPPEQRGTTPLPPWHDPSATVAHHHTPCVHPSVKMDHGGLRHRDRNGAGRREREPKLNKYGGPVIEHIDDPAVFSDVEALLALWRHEMLRHATDVLVQPDGSRVPWHERCTPARWVGAAVRAVQVTRVDRGVPAALFAHLVNKELWNYIDDDQLAHAHELLDAHAAMRNNGDRAFVHAVMRVAYREAIGEFIAARKSRPGISRAEWDELKSRHGQV